MFIGLANRLTRAGGDSPALTLDLLRSGLDSRLSFNRASAATDIIGGLLVSFASDAPRSSAANGLLIEGQATNLTTQSESLSTWSPAAATQVQDNVALNPYGLAGCRFLQETTAATTTHSTTFNHTGLTASTRYTWSVFVKSNAGGRNVRIVAYDSTAGVDIASAIFNPDTGNLLSGAGTYGVIPVGGGWYRVFVSGLTGASSTNIYGIIQLHNGASTVYTGDGASGVYLFGGQFEAGVITSYIPTTTAAATRAADLCTMALGSWFNTSEGTLYAEGKAGAGLDALATTTPRLLRVDNGTLNYGHDLRRVQTDGTARGGTTTNGVAQSLIMGSAWGNSTTHKLAYAYRLNDMAFSSNGSAASVDTSSPDGMPTGLTTLRIGTSSSINGFLNGWVRQVRYWPRRLNNEQLKVMTS